MPVKECVSNGKPGYKFGDQGKCYVYIKGNKSSEAEALRKAYAQQKAIESTGWKEK